MNDARRKQAEEAAKENVKTLSGFRYEENYEAGKIEGFVEGAEWADTTPMPSCNHYPVPGMACPKCGVTDPMPDAVDEEAANKYWRDNRDYHDSDGVDVAQVFKDGIAHARRTQAERTKKLEERLSNAIDDYVGLQNKIGGMYSEKEVETRIEEKTQTQAAEIERLKAELKERTDDVLKVGAEYREDIKKLRALLERAMEAVKSGNDSLTLKEFGELLSDYEKLRGDK